MPRTKLQCPHQVNISCARTSRLLENEILSETGRAGRLWAKKKTTQKPRHTQRLGGHTMWYQSGYGCRKEEHTFGCKAVASSGGGGEITKMKKKKHSK